MDNTKDWESLIAARMRPCVALKIEDASKRNSAESTKRWRKRNWGRYKEKQKEWLDANPDKKKLYRERNRKNVKRWAQEHPDRVREAGRRNDAKRRKTQRRIEWQKAYNARPDVKARRKEYYKQRNYTEKRREYERERNRKRRLAKLNAKLPSVITITLQDIGAMTVHIYKEFA